MASNIPETRAAHLSPEAEHSVRAQKVQELRALGIEPWPAQREVTATTAEVIEQYRIAAQDHAAQVDPTSLKLQRTGRSIHPSFPNETTGASVFAQELRPTPHDVYNEKKAATPEIVTPQYTVAGRVMTMREHGKTAFAHIQDRAGRLQIYIRQDLIGQATFDHILKFVDIGDIIWVKGHAFVTKTGEITLKAEDIALISKCLHPLPEKFHGLTDVETQYRQRYLDLISNPESKHRFIVRSQIVRTIRNFLDALDFVEVETPMLHPIPGGAAAKPFVTHHNALNLELYLRIAPELYLKRLVVGGIERVYEINRNFRNEGISTRHNPEFTMIELYIAHKDYHFAMDLVEEILRKAAQETMHTLQLPFGDHILDFEKPFERISMHDAVIKYGNLAPDALDAQTIDATIANQGITMAATTAWGYKLAALFEKLVEKNLINPTFITDFPIEISPLAKRDSSNPAIAARFELFIAGIELSNGFNELNDPYDQAARFHEQSQQRTAGDDEAHYYDADYVKALEYALPPTVGVGIGIDRLVMFLTNTTSIKDVILFPTLKPTS